MTGLQVRLDTLFTPALLWGTAVAVLLAVLVVPGLARRYDASRRLAAAASGSVAGILVLTSPLLSPVAVPQLWQAWSTSRATSWLTAGWTELRLVDLGVEGWANAALFLPAGCLLTLLTQRPVRVLLGLVALSLVVETAQAGLLARVADPRDLYANSLGAVWGVGLALVLVRAGLVPGRAPSAWFQGHPRRLVVAGAVVVSGAVIALSSSALLDAAADREQAELLASVRSGYEQTTARDVERAARRDEYLTFSNRAGVPADYLGVIGPGEVQARVSTGSQARPRCVLVTWRGERPPSFTTDAGPACLVFRGVGIP